MQSPGKGGPHVVYDNLVYGYEWAVKWGRWKKAI